jgi:hypothetical protein
MVDQVEGFIASRDKDLEEAVAAWRGANQELPADQWNAFCAQYALGVGLGLKLFGAKCSP